MEPPNTTSPITEAELHYKSLTEYFKHIVSITLTGGGVLLAIGLYITYKDMSSMRAEVRQNLSDVKAEIKQNMADVKADTKQLIESTRDQARTAIDSTRDAANLQISQIKGQSAEIALNEAQNRVESAFRTTNVQTLVEEAARRQVGSVIERQVKIDVDQAMDYLQQDISTLGRIADAGTRMRIGMRSGLDQMVALITSAPNDNVRQRAKAIFDSIAADYDTVVTDRLGGSSALVAAYGDKLEELRSKPEFIRKMVVVIRSDKDLLSVANSFLSLREATGYPFKMFDLESVEQWCTQHGEQCGGSKQ